MGFTSTDPWKRAAYDAIEDELKTSFGFKGSWWFLTPNNEFFRAADSLQAWRSFVGRVKHRYETDTRVSPHHTASADKFDAQSTKILGALRDALVSKTS